jgi:hypothetical protein
MRALIIIVVGRIIACTTLWRPLQRHEAAVKGCENGFAGKSPTYSARLAVVGEKLASLRPSIVDRSAELAVQRFQSVPLVRFRILLREHRRNGIHQFARACVIVPAISDLSL